MNVVEKVTIDIQKELENQVKDIAKKINELNNIDNFLQEAIDIQLLADINHSKTEAVGFNILITFGNPNIFFRYERGTAEVIGYWGGAEARQEIDTQKAQEILDHINEIIQ